MFAFLVKEREFKSIHTNGKQFYYKLLKQLILS